MTTLPRTVIVESKECSKCKETKPLTCFWKNKARKDGYQHYCTDCYNKIRKPSYLKRVYGISVEEWNTLFLKQGEKCAICSTTTDLCVDHNHITEKVRGLLCHKCNTALGLLQDNTQYLSNAIAYLNEPLSKTIRS